MGAFSDDPTPGRLTLKVDWTVTNNMLAGLEGGGLQIRAEHVDRWVYRREEPAVRTIIHKGLHGWYDGPHVEGDLEGLYIGNNIVLTLTPGVETR